MTPLSHPARPALVACAIAIFAGCGLAAVSAVDGSPDSEGLLVPVSLAALPSAEAIDEFFVTGVARTAKGEHVSIERTGSRMIPADDGLAHCLAAGSAASRGDGTSVDSRFSVTVENVDDPRRFNRIAQSIVELSEGDIRDLASSDVDELAVYDGVFGRVFIRPGDTALNSSPDAQISTEFHDRTDYWEPWDFLCAVHHSVSYDGGEVVMARRLERPTAMVFSDSAIDVAKVEEIPAFGMWIQQFEAPNGTIAELVNDDGSREEMLIGTASP